MLIVILVAAVVIVVTIIALAVGRGGGMSAERGDYAPLDLGPVSATDVALLRPPTGLWGYDMHATDEALERIAESIRERDVRIVALEQLVTDLGRDQPPTQVLGSPYPGARHRREPAASWEAAAPPGGAVARDQWSGASGEWPLVTSSSAGSGEAGSGEEPAPGEEEAPGIPPEESHD